MPVKARSIYILTQDGQIQGATYDQHKAENWLGLGDMYDYVGVTPEAVFDNSGDAPETRTEQPTKAMERSQGIMERQKAVQQRLNKRLRRLESPLLKNKDPFPD